MSISGSGTCSYPKCFRRTQNLQGCLENAIAKSFEDGKQAFDPEEPTTGGEQILFLQPQALGAKIHLFRINWSGSALSTFYAAIRKALVVVIVARAFGILFGLAFTGWWIFKS